VNGVGELIAHAAGPPQKQLVSQQLVSQLEPLLYLAYRLQLAPLQEVLHAFISNNASIKGGPLLGHMGEVLTQRVLQAAADTPVGQEALLKLQLWRTGGIQYPPPSILRGHPLLTAVDGSSPLPVVQFKAAVAQPLPCAAPGDIVDVKLDLTGGCLSLGGFDCNIQLLVGAPLATPAARQAVLGPEDASPAGG
jgi:hypothetical protein